jgi:hypothetical protein
MNIPKGGRGKKAPYETTIIRVPVPLVESIERQVNEYREFVVNGTQPPYPAINLEVALIHAKQILKQKKSAKVSLEKLLQVLYGDEVTLKD